MSEQNTILEKAHDYLIDKGFNNILIKQNGEIQGFDVWNNKLEEFVLSIRKVGKDEEIVVSNYARDNITKLNVINFKQNKTNRKKVIQEIDRQLNDRETNPTMKRMMKEQQKMRAEIKNG